MNLLFDVTASVLLHSSAEELSKRAVELEKRAIQLTIEEGIDILKFFVLLFVSV